MNTELLDCGHEKWYTCNCCDTCGLCTECSEYLQQNTQGGK